MPTHTIIKRYLIIILLGIVFTFTGHYLNAQDSLIFNQLRKIINFTEIKVPIYDLTEHKLPSFELQTLDEQRIDANNLAGKSTIPNL